MSQTAPGHRIKQFREHLGLSQVEFARLLGVSNVTVNRWEHGRVIPAPAMQARIDRAERFGFDATVPAPIDARTRLPTTHTPLIGRAESIAVVCDRVRRHPVVSIVGAGGAGKTRLAIAAAETLAPEFTHGAVFVDLAPVMNAESVVPAIAQAIGLPDPERADVRQAIIAKLATQSHLVILDNCEHVVSGIAALQLGHDGEMLSRVLATSRVELDIDGEFVYRIPDLALRDAVALFRKSADPEHDTDDGEASELVRHLDLLPLAIELAGARTRVLSVGQILQRLDQRLDLLNQSGGPATRQRTLRSTISWSCDLLSPAEAALFRSLSVFLDAFEITAAETIAGQPGLVPLLERLAAQSMLVVERVPNSDPRYRLLENLNAYGREWLAQYPAEYAEVTKRYRSFYADTIVSAVNDLHGRIQADAFARLLTQSADLLAAFESSLQHDPPEVIASFASALGYFALRTGRYATGVRHLEAAVTAADVERHPSMATVLARLARLRVPMGLYEQAKSEAERALNSATRSNDPRAEAEACETLGLVARAAARYDESIAYHERAKTNFAALGDVKSEGISLINIGHNYNVRAQLVQAEHAYLNAWSIIKLSDDPVAEMSVLSNLGDNVCRQGRNADALRYFDRAMIIARALQDVDQIATLATNAAETHARMGDAQAAVALAREAVSHFRAIGFRSHFAGSSYVLGVSLAGAGRPHEGQAALLDALDVYRQVSEWGSAGQTIEAIATIEATSGDPERAARWFGSGAAIRESVDVEAWELLDQATPMRVLRRTLGAARLEELIDAARALPRDIAISEVLLLAGAGAETGNDAQEEEAPFTPRQLEIMALVAEGRSNREIAAVLGISARTVERHLTHVFNKLGADRRSAAAAYVAGLKSGRPSKLG